MTSSTVRSSRAPVLGLAIIAIVVTGIVAWMHAKPDTKPPYHDAGAVGSLGLCDARGHQVTSGSTRTAPFIWRAVGTSAAEGAYAGPGRSATLYAFQPRSGVEPDQWSGRMLTAAAQYTNTAHPMAAATDADVALQDFLAGYPASDDGFVQLRLYLNAPNQQTLTIRYDALDIKVSGTTWRAVDGQQVDCASGASVSFETEAGIGS